MFKFASPLLARAANVPLLLFSSSGLLAERAPGLTSTSAQTWYDIQTVESLTSTLAGNKLAQLIKSESAVGHKDRPTQRNLKKRGFNAVLRWCALHQESRTDRSAPRAQVQSTESEFAQALALLDAAALQWITENAASFSCTQHMVLISFLCDIAQVPPSTQNSTASDFITRQRAISRVVALLAYRLTASDALESQPLSLQLTAAYALDKLCRACVDVIDEKEIETIEPPAALLFSILHHVRSGSALTEVCDGDKDEAVEVMLTLLVLMTPARRAAVLQDEDQYLLRDLVERLTPLLQSKLPLPSWRESRNEQPDAAARRDDVETQSATAATSENKTLDEVSLMDGTSDALAMLNGIATAEALTRCGSMRECLTLMHNIEFAKQHQRLTCLEYLLRVVMPVAQLSSEDLALLPEMFSTIETVPVVDRLTLTDNLVHQCRDATLSYHTVTGLLPFVRDPVAFAKERVHVTPAAVEAMTPAEALQLLSVRDLQLPWQLVRTLVMTTLNGLVPSGACSTTPVPLTASIVAFLRATLVHIDASDSVAGQLDERDDAATGEAACEEEPRAFFIASLRAVVNAVDWDTGLVPDAESGKSVTARQQLDTLNVMLAVQPYLAQARGDSESERVSWPTGAVFVSRYIEPVIESATRAHRRTLLVLSRAVSATWLDEATQTIVLRKAIAVSGTSTASALSRFLELFAADAVRLNVEDPGITKMLLKQRNVDPHMRIFSSHFTALTGAAYCQQYVQNVLLACRYALQTATSLPAERKEIFRSIASNWIYHCLLALAPRGADTAAETAPSGAEDATTKEVDPALAVSEADLELLLTFGVHFGCKPAASLHQLLNLRAAHLTERELQTPQWESPQADVLVSSRFSRVPDADQPVAGGNPYEDDEQGYLVPLRPAHFVFSMRMDVACLIPLTLTYLSDLLHRCHMAIFPVVVATFFAALKGRRTLPNLRVDLLVADAALRILVERGRQSGTDVASEYLLTDRSVVARDVIRAILGHLCRTRVYSDPLCALARGDVEQATSVDRTSDAESSAPDAPDREMEGTTQEVEDERQSTVQDDGDDELHTAPEERAADDEPGDTKDSIDDGLVSLHRATEASLCDAIDLLEVEQLKEVILGNSDRLFATFGVAAQHLFDRFKPQVPSLGPRDLLLLAVRYPLSEEAVKSQLSALDVRIHVDFGVFLRFTKSLPMSIVMLVTRAHMDSLSFAWTARLASSLSPRAERVPTDFLADVLGRLEQLAEKATDADRSLVLVILQHFIPASVQTRSHGAVPTADSSAEVTADDRRRLDLVQGCCDKLLLLDSVRDIASLEVFLNAYPPMLRTMVQESAVEQVHRYLMVPLLKEPLTDDTLKQLTALARLLHRNALFLRPFSGYLYRRVFKPLSTAAQHDASTPLPLAPLVELAVLIGSAKRRDGVPSLTAQRYGAKALGAVVTKRVSSPAERVQVLATIVDLRAGAAGQGQSPSLYVDSQVQRDVCLDALGGSDKLTASEFASLAQAVSRLRLWGLVKKTGDAEGQLAWFDKTFPAAFARADPHNRCVVLKAVSSDAEVFHRHEEIAMRFVQQDVPVLSHEDLELLLSAVLLVRQEEVAEAALDAISNRLLPMVEQCRRSTLVRLMQCHAQFHIHDTALFKAVLRTLEQQCERDLRLDVTQVLTLLHAIVTLELDAPDKVIVSCFQLLEKASSALTVQQQAQTAELLVALDMAYTSYVHALVVRVLENREGGRHSARLRQAAELLCDAYDVEAPPHLRIPRLRKRRETRRLNHYAEQCAASQ